MSKFLKPKTAGTVTQEEIDRVIEGADAVDDRRTAPKPEKPAEPEPAAAESKPAEVRFTMTLDGEMAERIDKARKGAGRLTRLSWIRVAIAEKLARDGA